MRGAIDKTYILYNFLVARFELLMDFSTCRICPFPAAAEYGASEYALSRQLTLELFLEQVFWSQRITQEHDH
jgi:hypothetical protein